jgi:hypothetical protein
MSRARNTLGWLIFFAMIRIGSVQAADDLSQALNGTPEGLQKSDEDPIPSSNDNSAQQGFSPGDSAMGERQGQGTQGVSFFKAGIGVQSGIRYHQPEKFNDFTTDIWISELTNAIDTHAAAKSIGPGVFLTLNGAIDIGSRFQAAPFAQGMWAGKQFFFRGGQTKDIYINTYTAMGGLNLWVRIFDNEKTTLRIGLGGYGASTMAWITGAISVVRLWGIGFGARGLIGSEIRLGRKAVLTLDCSVPYGRVKLNHKKGDIGAPVRYPSFLDQFGVEFCPGILFYF